MIRGNSPSAAWEGERRRSDVERIMRSCAAFALLLGACAAPTSTAAPLPAPPADWVQVYFTIPDQFNGEYRGGVDEAIVASLDAARYSIDVACLELNLYSISRALIRAADRGARVRVLVDSSYLEARALGDLEQAGLPVLGDRREGLMHDKFIVIDQALVWTGSMNLSTSDTYRNNNNMLRIESAELARAYSDEFDEMFVDDMFGDESPRGWPAAPLHFGTASLEAYFAPDDAPAARIVEVIGQARESIRFMAFSLTSDNIAEALVDRARRGVQVSGVMEESQVRSNSNGKYETLRAAGIDVRLDGNPRNMHHKVIVVDEAWVITGSYNFSYNAEYVNDENLLIIHDPDLAQRYLQEFDRIRSQAQ
jgi:phosphatidylserine/phosphatidylglycerophosphate/cardiolipin synthase-like enzyme